MRFSSIGLWVAAVLASANVAAAAEVETHPYAECAREPSEADLTAAKAAFQAGNVSFNEADYPRALLYWEDAFRRDCTAHPLLLNLARAYELDGQRQQAVIALEAFLAREPNSPERAQITRRIEVLKRQIDSEQKAAAAATAPPQTAAQTPPEAVTQPPAMSPSSSTSAKKIVPLAVAGVGGGITVLGLLLFADAHKDVNEYKKACGGTQNCPKELVEPANEAGKRETTGTIITIGGAAMLAGGVIWFLLTPSSTSKPASTLVRPNVAPGFAGLSVDGRF
jgi:tetratricopeptide (TPR) repeat protein